MTQHEEFPLFWSQPLEFIRGSVRRRLFLVERISHLTSMQLRLLKGHVKLVGDVPQNIAAFSQITPWLLIDVQQAGSNVSWCALRAVIMYPQEVFFADCPQIGSGQLASMHAYRGKVSKLFFAASLQMSDW